MELSLVTNGNAARYAQIRIADTGIGIAPEFLPHVFDHLRQADGSSTCRYGGLGLGGAIVRHLVQLHGGVVVAESPGIGQGATFTVLLPWFGAAVQPEIAISSDLCNSPSLAGIRVLVVDDSDKREFVKFILQQSGATVATADSVLAALSIIEQDVPDLLLSDIGMPDMDGYALLQAIRSLPSEAQKVSAIALTAYATETDRQRAISVGFQDCLSKPIEPNLLIAKVLAAIEQARQPEI